MSLDEFSLVRGKIQKNVSLSKLSWYGVGGTADVLFTPEDMDDLVNFLKTVSEDTPITVLGAMSNVLIRSGGIRGVVIVLGKNFKRVYAENNVLEVGAALSCTELSIFATDHELGGLEFLMGLPGTVGGAIRMNAGCYDSEIFDVVVEFESVTFSGDIKWLKAGDVKAEYRCTDIPSDYIITRAWFRGNAGVSYPIAKKANEIFSKRKSNQPVEKRSCGSTFKNPEGAKAWQLIDAAGCRGMRVGGAIVSDKHCNFILNDGTATAEDIEQLGEQVIEKVWQNSGINLEWEVIRLGEAKN